MKAPDPKTITSIWKLGGLTWRELAGRVWLEIYAGGLFTRAAALSYYFLLALFPLLLCLMAMLGYFANTRTELRSNLLSYLGQVVPRSASALIDTTLNEVSNNAGRGKLSFGLLAALWFASSGMGAMSATLNATYGIKESRPWWRVRLSAVGLTIALAVLVISALILVLYGGEIGEMVAARFGLGVAFRFAWKAWRWPIVLVFVLFVLALIYHFGPHLEHRKWHWITPGSVTGAGLWMLVSFCFRVYLRYFDRYSLTYGSLGAVIILMLWFYLTGAAILVGGKVNAEIEQAAAEQVAPGAQHHGEKRHR